MKVCSLNGSLSFEGDKSLSHRAVILAGMSKGRSQIKNFLKAEDTMNTLKAMRRLGVEVVSDPHSDDFEIISEGIDSLCPGEEVLDMGNSGTGARLLLGLIAGHEKLKATIDGDASLRKRPMSRVTSPLSSFGADFKGFEHLPISVTGKNLRPIDFQEKLGSAQVKSACILAGLSSQVEITLREHKLSRDHTENMLHFTGIHVERKKKDGFNEIYLQPPYEIMPRTFDIWGDVSSAAFFVVMASLIRGSELKICDVLLNQFRTGYLNILNRMKASIKIQEKESRCGEQGGDLFVKHSPMKNVSISPQEVPSVIDEIPILTTAAMFSEGTFELRGAEELRHKESDRIHALCSNLSSLGYECEEYPDGFKLEGDPDHIPEGEIQGFRDHRIIMAFEAANQVAQAKSSHDRDLIYLQGDSQEKKWIETSFPDFYEKIQMAKLNGAH